MTATPPPPQTSLAALIAGGALLTGSRVLLAVCPHLRADGWRRAAGQVLRGEESAFVLSAFGLTPPAHMSGSSLEAIHASTEAQLRAFLRDEPLGRVCVLRSPDVDRPAPCADDASCTISFVPWRDGPDRFVPPTKWTADGQPDPFATRDGVAPMMNAVCRTRADGLCDIWLRINHAATDGVPVQELLTRLETAWRGPERVLFPTPEQFAPFAAIRPIGGRPGVAETTWFADFSRLLAWRKGANAALPAGQTMTVSAAILWRLAQSPGLQDLFFGTTVETAEQRTLPRGVGVNVVCPARFAHLPSAEGLARYVTDFNRQLELNRRRASSGCRTLDAAALLPPRLSAGLLRHALRRTPAAFGTMALTMLKDAKVFCTPIAEVGHDDGFIAIGSLALPTADGRAVGCISLKGPAERVARYRQIIAKAIEC